MSNPFGSAQAAPEPQSAGNPFAQPSRGGGGGDSIGREEWQENVGRLVLFEVSGWRPDVATANGTADAVEATVTVIDAPGDGPKVYANALIFPPALVTALKECRNSEGITVAKAGEKPYMVLGRLGRYETKAGRVTVELLEHTPQDAETATKFLAWRAQEGMKQPQTQAAPAKAAEEPPF